MYIKKLTKRILEEERIPTIHKGHANGRTSNRKNMFRMLLSLLASSVSRLVGSRQASPIVSERQTDLARE